MQSSNTCAALARRHTFNNRQSRLNADHINVSYTSRTFKRDQKYYTRRGFPRRRWRRLFSLPRHEFTPRIQYIDEKTRPSSYLLDERGGGNGVFVVSDDITVSNHPARSVDTETITYVYENVQRADTPYLLGVQNQRQYTYIVYTADKILSTSSMALTSSLLSCGLLCVRAPPNRQQKFRVQKRISHLEKHPKYISHVWYYTYMFERTRTMIY